MLSVPIANTFQSGITYTYDSITLEIKVQYLHRDDDDFKISSTIGHAFVSFL